MPASSATSGFSTLWQDNTGGSYASVAEVERIGGPKVMRQMIDVTNLTSPSEAEEFIAGLIKTGEIAIDMNFLPGATAGQSQRNILANIQNGTKIGAKIIFSDSAATTWSFNGYYTAFEPSAPKDNKLSAKVAFKITGPLTIPT